MKPISEFPYGNDMKPSNPMHKKMLLLQLKSSVFTHFAFGYYDACDDLFYICQSSFMDTPEHEYKCRPTDCEGICCMMPPNFTQKVGQRRITHYMEMNEVLTSIQDMKEENIDSILEIGSFAAPYLVCLYGIHTYDDKLIISEISQFTESGRQFSANTPSDINGSIYHMSGPVPRENVVWAVNLLQWREGLK